MKKVCISLFLSILNISFSFAQLGLNPSTLRWHQIDTEKVKVIFPEGLEKAGQRTANTIHYLFDNNTESIGDRSEKITIILQNQTAISNGFVSLIPFRSEFYITAPQFGFLGTGDWMDLLAIHEYRHVQQNANARTGITKLISHLFGQNGWAFMRAMAVPRWYMEGDAVVTETALSSSGRGRLPDFIRQYRFLRLNDRKYNYEKASAGSLQDFVPDHYHLGFFMTSYARKNYGREIWKGVLDDAARYKGIFYPFNRGLKKRTGMGAKKMYNAAMLELDSLWEADLAILELTESEKVNTKKNKTYTNYNHPVFSDNEKVLVDKSSFQEIRTLYELDMEGNEKRIATLGFNTPASTSLSYADGKIVWAELSFDERWIGQDFSIIKMLDLKTKAKKKLSSQSKYFAPDLASDASKIVVAEVSTKMENALVILNGYNGSVIKKITNPENLFFSYPQWMPNDQQIVVTAQKAHQNALLLVNAETDEITTLVDYTTHQMLNPYPHGDYVYFSGAHTGINNIFAVNVNDKSLYQITSTKLGAYFPSVSPDGKTLVFSEFTENGHEISKMPIEPKNWKKVNKFEDINAPLYQHLIEQEGGNIAEKIPKEEFSVERFKKINGLFNIYGFQPFIAHPNYTGSFQLQNKMSTFAGQVGYNYNVNERSNRFFANLTYAEFYPIFQAGINTGGNRNRLVPFTNEFTRGDTSEIFLSFYTREWEENDFFAGVTFPFNLSQGAYATNLQFSSFVHYLDINYENVPLRFNDREQLRNGDLNSLDFLLEFSNFKRLALQNLNPRFGQVFNLSYKQTFNSQRNEGSQFNATGRLFFPGFFQNHSFYVDGGYQREGLTNTYKFRDDFFYSRGYPDTPHDQVTKFGVNYSLPLFYPDMALGSLAFIKRVKVNFFYDHTQIDIDPIPLAVIPNNTPFPLSQERGAFEFNAFNLRSAGAELTFDFRAFRLLDIDMGVRYSRLLDQNPFDPFRNENRFELVLVSIGQ